MGDESYGLGGLRQFFESASSLLSFDCQYICPTECIYDNIWFIVGNLLQQQHLFVTVYFKTYPNFRFAVRSILKIPSLVG